jgi:7-keto-8-aminopelargonate synthetase-like enzyme
MPTPVLSPCEKVHIIWNGKRYLFFGGYDYHRLSRHPELADAMVRALDIHGLNCGGSRVTTGNHPLHIELENKLSEFLDTEDTALLPTGYMANIALFEVFSDKDIYCYYHPACHPSLKVALKMSGLPGMEIPADLDLWDAHIRDHGKKPCVITDSVYAELPPLKDYETIVEKYDGALVIDEAHAIGILGEHGRGLVEQLAVSKKHLLITGSLSKAVGVAGGFVSGLAGCVKAVRSTTAYATTSAMPLPTVAAATASLDYLTRNPQLFKLIQQRSLKVKEELRDGGFDIPVNEAPGINIYIEDHQDSKRLAGMLEKAGIYPSYIRYPQKPDYFRFTLSSAHTDEEIDLLINVLKKFKTR